MVSSPRREKDGGVEADDDAALFDANFDVAFGDFILQLAAQQIDGRRQIFERRLRGVAGLRGAAGGPFELVAAVAAVLHGAA